MPSGVRPATKVALAGGGTSDESVQVEFPDRAEDGGDVTVGETAQATEKRLPD